MPTSTPHHRRPERAIHNAQRTTHPGANDRRFTSTEDVKYFAGSHPQVASCPNIPEQVTSASEQYLLDPVNRKYGNMGK